MNLFFASQEAGGGIAAFGLNIKAFAFQLITFGIVVFFLNKFVLKKLFKIIDARQAEINAGLDRAKRAQSELEKAGEKVEAIIKDAREQADALLHDAKNEAAGILKEVDVKAGQKAERIVSEARKQLQVDIEKAKKDLRQENVRLIAKVSGDIIGEKLDSDKDAKLIANALEKS